jgi:SPP1 family predicted phage head-tail adaptor
MDVASLKKPIRLEKWTAARDHVGDPQEGVTRYDMWAEVEDAGGTRGTLNGRTSLSRTKVFRVLFRPNFKPTGKWSIVYDGARYTVSSVLKDEEKRFVWVFTATGK